MSDGGQQTVPVTPNSPPTVVVQHTWEERAWKIAFAIVILVASYFVKSGKIDADAAKQAEAFLLAKAANQNMQVTTSTEATMVSPARTTTATVSAVPSDALVVPPSIFDQMIAAAKTPEGQIFIQWLIEQVKPKPPEPTPVPPTPAPKPVPVPDVVPVPTPTPTVGLKIIITDETDKVVSATTVDPGKLFQVSAAGAKGDVSWQKSTHGEVSVLSLKSGGFAFSLQPGAWVELFATDYGSQQQVSARISANQGAQPPPTPVNPPVPDNGDTKPVKSRKLMIAVVEDAQHRSLDTATILNAITMWNGFRDRGHDWRFYDVATTEAKGKIAVTRAGAILPAIVLSDLTTGELVDTEPLPKTTKAINDLITKWSGQ